MNEILTFSVPAEKIKIEEKEVLRYLGYGAGNVPEEDRLMISGAESELRGLLFGRGCCGRFKVSVHPNGRIIMPYGEIISADLAKNLDGCDEIFIAAATIGAGFDAALRKAQITSASKAAVYQAIGAAAAESVMDALNGELKALAASEGLSLKPRYSPGYGDFTLEQQRGIFSVIQPEKNAGIHLTKSLVMTPEKSVTAVIGIKGA